MRLGLLCLNVISVQVLRSVHCIRILDFLFLINIIILDPLKIAVCLIHMNSTKRVKHFLFKLLNIVYTNTQMSVREVGTYLYGNLQSKLVTL